MTEISSLAIRHASLEDVDGLAKLATQLGYPNTAAQICPRLETLIESSAENAVFVAELDGEVVGWVHVHVYRLLMDDPETEIGGLVVDEKVRGQRIGEKLVQAAEAWTVETGCSSVYVRSNTLRTRAHDFYERLGYTNLKSQYAFRKRLK